MSANPNPIETIAGLTSNANISKADIVNWGKTRLSQSMADASEVNNTDLAGQFTISLKSTGRVYNLDTSDTTTADDGVNCIRDASNAAYKIVTIVGLDGQGNVNGPVTNTDGFVPQWNGANSKTLKDGLRVGTAANCLVQLDSSGRYPALDGSLITNISAGVILTNLIRPEDYGAKGDGVVNASGGAITTGTNVFTQSGYTFVSGDVGKYIAIDGAGAGGATLATTISSVSGGSAHLAVNASTSVTSAANEWGTDDDAALVALANASAGKAIWFGAGKIYFRSGSLMLYPVGPFTIYGNGATVRCTATAPSSTYGFMFTDAPFTGGPSNYGARDLTYEGNRTRRISSGAISAAVYSETGFYSINGKGFTLINCIARGTTCDGFFTGGQASIGKNCQDFRYIACLAEDAGRNGHSIGGASYGSFLSCVSQNHTFGAAHSNISVGYDYEPSGANYGNANIKMLDCTASNCTHVGFNSQAGGASNDGLAWGFCRAELCGIGFQTDNAAGTKVTAAEYAANTTNFSGLSEKISGY